MTLPGPEVTTGPHSTAADIPANLPALNAESLALPPELLQNMPSPEEIQREAEIEMRNAEVRASREADLARRRDRRIKAGRPKRGDLKRPK